MGESEPQMACWTGGFRADGLRAWGLGFWGLPLPEAGHEQGSGFHYVWFPGRKSAWLSLGLRQVLGLPRVGESSCWNVDAAAIATRATFLSPDCKIVQFSLCYHSYVMQFLDDN